jgi:hypothetical protein
MQCPQKSQKCPTRLNVHRKQWIKTRRRANKCAITNSPNRNLRRANAVADWPDLVSVLYLLFHPRAPSGNCFPMPASAFFTEYLFTCTYYMQLLGRPVKLHFYFHTGFLYTQCARFYRIPFVK